MSIKTKLNPLGGGVIKEKPWFKEYKVSGSYSGSNEKVPYSGWYSVLLVGGGGAGFKQSVPLGYTVCGGGGSGSKVSYEVYIDKNSTYTVTVGASGDDGGAHTERVLFNGEWVDRTSYNPGGSSFFKVSSWNSYSSAGGGQTAVLAIIVTGSTGLGNGDAFGGDGGVPSGSLPSTVQSRNYSSSPGNSGGSANVGQSEANAKGGASVCPDDYGSYGEGGGDPFSSTFKKGTNGYVRIEYIGKD